MKLSAHGRRRVLAISPRPIGLSSTSLRSSLIAIWCAGKNASSVERRGRTRASGDFSTHFLQSLRRLSVSDVDIVPDALFMNELAKLPRCSRSTIERRRRAGNFPIPELPCFDRSPRWSRHAVEAFLASTDSGLKP